MRDLYQHAIDGELNQNTGKVQLNCSNFLLNITKLLSDLVHECS